MNQIYKKGFNWNPQQIYRFESLYAIFSIFVEQNHALVRDIWDIFGDESKQNRKTESGTAINLNYGKHITLQRLYNETNFTYDHLSFHTVFDYLPVKIIHRDRYNPGLHSGIYSVLRFCPQCMARKYHTPLFQLDWIVKCPFHGVKLETHCQKCNASMPYELTAKLFRKPFHCTCGHPFSNNYKDNTLKNIASEKPIRQYLKVVDKAFKNNMYVNFNDLSSNITQLLNDGYFYLIEYYVSIFNLINTQDNLFIHSIEPYKLAVFKNDKHLVKKKCQITKHHSVEYLSKYNDPKYFNKFLVTTNVKKYSQIILSLIRKRYFMEHEECIIKIKNLMKNYGIVNYSFICPYAFAYILWEMYWKNEISKMIGSYKYDVVKNYNEHFHILYEQYMHFNEFYYTEEDKYKNAISSRWLIHNVLYLFAYHTILQTIRFTVDTKSKTGEPIPRQFINYFDNPFYILNESDDSLKFISALYDIKVSLKKIIVRSADYKHHEYIDKVILALKSTDIKKSNITTNRIMLWCKDAINSITFNNL